MTIKWNTIMNLIDQYINALVEFERHYSRLLGGQSDVVTLMADQIKLDFKNIKFSQEDEIYFLNKAISYKRNYNERDNDPIKII